MMALLAVASSLDASASISGLLAMLPDPKTMVMDAIAPIQSEFLTKFVPVMAGLTLLFALLKRFGRAS